MNGRGSYHVQIMTKLALVLALLALPPAPARYVSDPSNVLDDGRENALNERLAQYERETSNQLIVYVDRSVPEGTTLEEMSTEALRTWDKSVILFLFIDDRRSRIEVAPELSARLTDARAKEILVEMRQPLRDGFYTTAAEQGVERIIGTLAAPVAAPLQAPPVEPRTSGPLPAAVMLFGLIVLLGVAVLVPIIAFVRSSRNGGGIPAGVWPQQPFPPNDPQQHHHDPTPMSFVSNDTSWNDSSSSSSTPDDNSSSGHGASDQW